MNDLDYMTVTDYTIVEEIHFKCPKCKATNKVELEYLQPGGETECDYCDQLLIIEPE